MNPKGIDLLEQLQRLWQWVFGIQHWNTLEGLIARIVIWIVFVYLSLRLLYHLLETIAKIAEYWKSIGFEINRSPEKLARLRRCQQFCRVLASDLATLAKAESWNDQFFTDLEAEVEAEGDYYASRIDRLFRRRSHGLRRVPSLIEAIESSTEQCLLVTGDPGSGKSIALRHLANQMAEKASKSKSSDVNIPLYLNLKELPEPPLGGPSADFIKEFVLENIRRGDADTAAYVRDNWSSYREHGRWFFLFDSFDEIPAVLHAPTGSAVIRQHADAIRQFFEGMSACRGVLASREFKGPDALPWKRFRILQLSPSRQEELIGNSFLSPELKSIASQHTAASGSGFLTNPLFLTLLCRYVKEEKRPPTSDNELLLRHIYRLANREPDYVRRRYDLTPEQLLEGSIRLSVLFAEQPSLSLAPTQDQISKSLSGEHLPGDDLEKLIAALIDVKIGRCDVKEAKAGDRRFTFAHRRYQETLFVEHLARNPSYLSPNALLTDLRWRDYTVTLLQTSPSEVITPLLAVAASILQELAKNNRGTSVMPGYGSEFRYFEWKESSAARLLELLQEGLRRRLELVPDILRQSVRHVLELPWEEGDSYDRLMVIHLGGLLPERDLQDKIEWAVQSGTIHHWNAAVSSSFFLTRMSEKLAHWFRAQLADRLLIAHRRADILRLEAIATRAPVNIGAAWIIKRARVIRKLFQFFDAATRKTLSLGLLAYPRRNYKSIVSRAMAGGFQLYATLLSWVMIGVGVRLWKHTNAGAVLVMAVGACLFVKLVRHFWLYCFRAVGEELNSKSIAVFLDHTRTILVKALLANVKYIAIGFICVGVTGGVVHVVAWKLGYRGEVFPFYCLGPLGVLLPLRAGLIIEEARDRRACAARLRSARKNTTSGVALILRASSWEEVRYWLRSDWNEVIPSSADARSCLRFIEAVSHGLTPCGGATCLEGKGSLTPFDSERLISLLMFRLFELEFTSDKPTATVK
ncbi:MAG: NACHT domain-containing protein [Verrucomicrobiia bacterium]